MRRGSQGSANGAPASCHHRSAASGRRRSRAPKELRDCALGCATFLFTPGGDIEDAIEILRAGALDYLCPPTDPDRLPIAFSRVRGHKLYHRVAEVPSILVIEDHESTRKRLTGLLDKEGYQVSCAGNGEEGMRLFREKRFDLIVTDVKMPVKDGIEVLRETKGAGCDVEVIVITGYGNEELVPQALREGAIKFLRKPIDIEYLLLAVEKALDYQTARRSLAYRSRELGLMHELVVRLTRQLDLIVETPYGMSDSARGFLRRLVDALSVGIAVAGPGRENLYVNDHVVSTIGETPENLSADWLKAMGPSALTEEDLQGPFARATKAQPGTVETLTPSQWSSLVLTPVTLVRAGGATVCVRDLGRPRADRRESGPEGMTGSGPCRKSRWARSR